MLQEDPHIGSRLREFLMLVKSPPAQALTAKQTLQSLDRLVCNSGAVCSVLICGNSNPRHREIHTRRRPGLGPYNSVWAGEPTNR